MTRRPPWSLDLQTAELLYPLVKAVCTPGGPGLEHMSKARARFDLLFEEEYDAARGEEKKNAFSNAVNAVLFALAEQYWQEHHRGT